MDRLCEWKSYVRRSQEGRRLRRHISASALIERAQARLGRHTDDHIADRLRLARQDLLRGRNVLFQPAPIQ